MRGACSAVLGLATLLPAALTIMNATPATFRLFVHMDYRQSSPFVVLLLLTKCTSGFVFLWGEVQQHFQAQELALISFSSLRIVETTRPTSSITSPDNTDFDC